MNRRRAILAEMGIAPLWRLRAPRTMSEEAAAGTLPESHAAPSAKADVPPPERRGDHTIASANADTESDSMRRIGRSPARKRAVVSSETPAPSRDGRADQLRAARADTEIAPQDDARRQQITVMDWVALKDSVAQCVACPLHEKRTQTVFGVGDERAEWLFVGEGPGAEEDARGEPFVGQAGRLLDNMLAAIELARGNNVYIANVVKCRPPNNRNPEPREMRCCEPYLARQIALIQPKLIVALGKTAANHLLQTDASIASLRGRVHAYRGTPLIVTYHPAYLLRTLQEKSKAWADLCFARETMAGIQAKSSTAPHSG